MDDKNFNKFIGYAIWIILAYYVLGYLIQYLVWGVVGLVLLKIFYEYQRTKK